MVGKIIKMSLQLNYYTNLWLFIDCFYVNYTDYRNDMIFIVINLTFVMQYTGVSARINLCVIGCAYIVRKLVLIKGDAM